MSRNAHYIGKIAKIIRNNQINTMKHSIYKKMNSANSWSQWYQLRPQKEFWKSIKESC